MQFEIRKPNVSSFGLFLRIASSVQGVCGAMPILGLLFYFCEKCLWNFDRYCIESINGFGHYGQFNNIHSLNPWIWKIFVFTYVFIFFCQCLTVNVHFEDLSSPQLIHSWVFCFWYYCKCNSFLYFFFR